VRPPESAEDSAPSASTAPVPEIELGYPRSSFRSPYGPRVVEVVPAFEALVAIDTPAPRFECGRPAGEARTVPIHLATVPHGAMTGELWLSEAAFDEATCKLSLVRQTQVTAARLAGGALLAILEAPREGARPDRLTILMQRPSELALEGFVPMSPSYGGGFFIASLPISHRVEGRIHATLSTWGLQTWLTGRPSRPADELWPKPIRVGIELSQTESGKPVGIAFTNAKGFPSGPENADLFDCP
jgi:hypothetical protein